MLTWSGRWAVSINNEEFIQLKARNKKDALKEIKEMYSESDVDCVWIGRAYRYDPHIFANEIINDLKGSGFANLQRPLEEQLKVGKSFMTMKKFRRKKSFRWNE